MIYEQTAPKLDSEKKRDEEKKIIAYVTTRGVLGVTDEGVDQVTLHTGEDLIPELAVQFEGSRSAVMNVLNRMVLGGCLSYTEQRGARPEDTRVVQVAFRPEAQGSVY